MQQQCASARAEFLDATSADSAWATSAVRFVPAVRNREEVMMHVGIAADHGAFALKGHLEESLRSSGYEVVDFGAYQLNAADDYPDFIIPLAKAVAAGEVERGIALCGSGVGASIAANKVPGVRAGLIHRCVFRPSGRRRRRHECLFSRWESCRRSTRMGTGRDLPGCPLQQRSAPPTPIS